MYKKVFKFLCSLALILSVYKVNASDIELTYSDWSTLYPSGLDSSFIESEDRYHFYRVVDNQIEYTDEYYTQLDGYIKDEQSRTTFYRYITNQFLVFDDNNRMLLNYTDYCKKNFCFLRRFVEPIMTDLSEKTQGPDYSNTEMFEINTASVPLTFDNVLFSVSLLLVSLLSLLVVCISKKRKLSRE